MAFTEQDLDAILASVDVATKEAERLTKSKEDSEPMKKDMQPEDMQEAPEMAAPAPEEAPPMDAAPEMEAQPEEQEAPAEEADEMMEMSDEELHEAYASMSPDELERHAMIIQSLMGGQEEQAPEQDMPEEQPLQASEEESEEEKKEEEKKEEEKEEDKEDMQKSEKIASLEKQVRDQAKTMALMQKAVEILNKPVRKSVAGIEFITKSETKPASTLSDDEIRAKLLKTDYSKLNKSDREAITAFTLRKDRREDVLKLIEG
jgi:hypothetical protein